MDAKLFNVCLALGWLMVLAGGYWFWFFIRVDVGVGRGTARVWTCDLTDGYVKINGAYRS